MIHDRKNTALFCSIVVVTLFFAIGSIGFSESTNHATLKGWVIHKETKKAIPGLKVFLVSTVYGRSVLKVTENDGSFTLKRIPISEEKYYIEIYEADNLVYRKELEITDDMDETFEVGK